MSGFTAQLVAGHEERTALRFLDQHASLPELRYTRTERAGRDWFVVYLGQFGDREQARESLPALPDSVRKLQPWIRPFSEI